MSKKIKTVLLCVVLAFSLVFYACSDKNKHNTDGILSDTECTVETDDSYFIKTKTDASLTWSSRDENIARVDKRGKVTGVSVGETVIEATDGNVKSECKVTVVEKNAGADSYVLNLAKSEYTLQTDKECDIEFTLTHNGVSVDSKPTWESSDETVATVADGKVKALKAGTAVISVSYENTGAKCTVYVYDGEYALRFEQTDYNAEKGDDINVSPILYKNGEISEENVDLAWTISGNAVALSDGKLTAVMRGTSYVTASYGSVRATCRIKVYDSVSINSVSDFLSIKSDNDIVYNLTGDLDFSGYAWTSQTVISKFGGILNGNGYKLENLDRPQGTVNNYCGLFETVAEGAEIKNLLLYFDNFAYQESCGILAVNNYGYVHDCYVKADKTEPVGIGNGSNIGKWLTSGLIAKNETTGTLSGLIVDITANNMKAAFNAITPNNSGIIKDCLIISKEEGSYGKKDGTELTYYYKQIVSKSTENSYLSRDDGGWKTYYMRNDLDAKRSDCYIFDSYDKLLSGSGYDSNMAHEGIAEADKDARFENYVVSDKSVYTAKFGNNWSFEENKLTFFGNTIYQKA